MDADAAKEAEKKANVEGLQLPTEELNVVSRAISEAVTLATGAPSSSNDGDVADGVESRGLHQGLRSDEPMDEKDAYRARRAALAAAQRGCFPAEVVACAKRAAADPKAKLGKSAFLEALVSKETALAIVRELASAKTLTVVVLIGPDESALMETVTEAIEDGEDPLMAALICCGSSVAEIGAAMAAACHAAEQEPQPKPLAIACAALSAVIVAGANGPPDAAVKAGRVACAKCIKGVPQDEILASATALAKATAANAAATEAKPIEIPCWSTKSWLGQLDLAGVVSQALLYRLKQELPEGGAVHDFELGFVQALSKNATEETIASMLKETPVLRLLAKEILDGSRNLMAGIEEAEAAAAKVSKEGESTYEPPKVEAMLSAEDLNELAKQGGAFTLAFSNDISKYWGGVEQAVGEHNQRASLYDGLKADHCNHADSSVSFTPNNYPTSTTSKIEWLFVVDPSLESLSSLGVEEWPGTRPRAAHVPPRRVLPLSHFATARAGIDDRLHIVGERE